MLVKERVTDPEDDGTFDNGKFTLVLSMKTLNLRLQSIIFTFLRSAESDWYQTLTAMILQLEQEDSVGDTYNMARISTHVKPIISLAYAYSQFTCYCIILSVH